MAVGTERLLPHRPPWGSLAIWAILAIAPLAAYAQTLWQNALADTPIAYLVWIPILAVAWGAWNLAAIADAYVDDSEVNLLVGGFLVVVAGFLMAVGSQRWPILFVYDHGGLLVWPLWAMGLAWLLFGIGVTRRLLAPLAYLWLAWPPIFRPIVNLTQAVLTHWAVAILTVSSHLFSWIRPAMPVGNFYVEHGGRWVGIVIAQACSGADSLLGAAILLPLLLTLFRGNGWARAVLVLSALLGALVINWVRLVLLVGSVHWLGGGFTFGVLHPVLGFVLFTALAFFLMWLAWGLGLRAGALPGRPALKVGGVGKFLTAAVVSALLFIALLPLFRLPVGSLSNPMPVSTANTFAMLPPMAGFHSVLAYHYNESSVLGAGAYTVARLYANNYGAGVTVEVWNTPDHNKLLSYGFDNCLIYHGNDILSRQSFAMSNGLPVTLYAVSLPPRYLGGARLTYLDLEWQTAVSTPAGVRYLRWSVASYPWISPGWPTVHLTTFPLHGLDALAVPPSQGKWPASLEAPRVELERFALALMDRFQQSLAVPSK